MIAGPSVCRTQEDVRFRLREFRMQSRKSSRQKSYRFTRFCLINLEMQASPQKNCFIRTGGAATKGFIENASRF